MATRRLGRGAAGLGRERQVSGAARGLGVELTAARTRRTTTRPAVAKDPIKSPMATCASTCAGLSDEQDCGGRARCSTRDAAPVARHPQHPTPTPAPPPGGLLFDQQVPRTAPQPPGGL